jgi:hypothetical protein
MSASGKRTSGSRSSGSNCPSPRRPARTTCRSCEQVNDVAVEVEGVFEVR